MTPNFSAPACMHPSPVAALALRPSGACQTYQSPPSHWAPGGVGVVGFVGPASFNRGLRARLLRVLGSERVRIGLLTVSDLGLILPESA